MKKRAWILLLGLLFAFSACEKVDSGKSTHEGKIDERLIKRFILSSQPHPAHMVNANFGNEIEIIGFDVLPKVPVKGRFFTITLYYKVLNTPSKDWIFFGHLEPVSGPAYRVRLDHKPMMGAYPVSMWKKGEILKDTYRVKLPPDFPTNKGVLWVGFYVENPKKPDWENRLHPTDKSKTDGKGRLRAGIIDMKGGKPVKPKQYTVFKVKNGAIKIDGKLDESVWEKAPWVGFFVDPMGNTTKAHPPTNAKLLWDDKNLYVAFVCDDPDIFTTYTKNDDPIYKQEAAEIMIDADNNGREYFELQVAPNGLIFDKFFHGGPRQGEDLAWKSGMKSAVSVDGTLNKRDDTDKRWIAEIAIPFAKVFPKGKGAPNVPPKDGDKWRADLFRVDHSGKRNRGSYIMWSPVYANDFHTLRNWGYLTFSEKEVDKPNEKKDNKKIKK